MTANPAYNPALLCTACASGTAILRPKALVTANAYFGMATQGRVLAFIADGGLEQAQFINCLPLEKNTDPTTPIDVDAYQFFSGPRHGYIAFYYQPRSERWIIKSFKKYDPSGFGTSETMLLALRKTGLIK